MAQEVLQADDPAVSLNDPSAGRTRITLPTLTYVTGTNELFVFYNGTALVVGVDYTEEDSTHVILEFLPDATSPDVDTLEFITVQQGSSAFVPPPVTLLQVDPPKRSDNFGGRFVHP
jgi:hypothetical protein